MVTTVVAVRDRELAMADYVNCLLIEVINVIEG